MQQDSPTRNLQNGNGQALASAAVRFPAEDGGRSLGEMAQRDLDAALQLLANRAQYITGATGAAIALRRSGMNDMLCRASTGSNAPELGALLSTEFGLSGESVRTRKALRCDDAERDARVNRDVCRQLGIASVVVMPVVHDDEVLGVFELFSGQAHAFGDRDISAIKRLSEMVETAVRMAHATENLPRRLSADEPSASDTSGSEETILDVEVFETHGLDFQAPLSVPVAKATPAPVSQTLPVHTAVATPQPTPAEAQVPKPLESSMEKLVQKKPLFWSAAASGADTPATPLPDQSHIPPVLRSLRKCEACGFPVSPGRSLCVECEEKRWRGQLKRP